MLILHVDVHVLSSGPTLPPPEAPADQGGDLPVGRRLASGRVITTPQYPIFPAPGGPRRSREGPTSEQGMSDIGRAIPVSQCKPLAPSGPGRSRVGHTDERRDSMVLRGHASEAGDIMQIRAPYIVSFIMRGIVYMERNCVLSATSGETKQH